MNQDQAIITRIVDEMITCLFHLDAKNIDINYKDEDDCYIITFKCDYCKDKQPLIYRMVKYINMERQEEMESYYWELAGQYNKDTELTLVGMMTDEAKVYFDDNRVEVLLIRKK